jgi:probable rRNA maturation factor
MYEVDGVKMPRLDRERVLKVITAALRKQGGTLTVLFVSEARSAELHGLHFLDPSPTDVMTFPDGSTDPDGGILLGDLAVCVPVAQREARRRKRPLADELTLYILHGVLHLLGYDDADEQSRRAMWTVQRRLLGQVGITVEAKPG